MKAAFARVAAAQLRRQPVPHFVADDVLSADELRDILAHWPDGARFPEDDIGSGYRILRFELDVTWSMLTRAQRTFWTDFIYGLCLQLVQGTFLLYAPLIKRRFGSALTAVDLVTVSLTEFEHEAVRSGVHAHNDEATWLFTNLIHIDDGGATDRGNALYGFSGQERMNDLDPALRRIAATHPGHGPEEMVPLVQIPFKPGRMFSFYETPLSYHGNEIAGRNSPHARRRMIRLHARAPLALSRHLYGVESEEFRALRHKPGENERIVSWMKSDIALMNEPPTTAPEPDCLRYAGGIEFLGIRGAPRPPLMDDRKGISGIASMVRRTLSRAYRAMR
ncbi:MAG: hypothetical protein ACT4N4_15130 [Rhodospirillales bacterium]